MNQPTNRVKLLPAFTPLSDPEKDAYSDVMTRLGLESATMQEIREFGQVSETAKRFVGWVALNGIQPDLERRKSTPMFEGNPLHQTTRTRVVTHHHGHSPHPDGYQTSIDKNFWLISELGHGSKPYAKTARWLVGATVELPIEVGLFDNHGGRIPLNIRTSSDKFGHERPLASPEVDFNTQLLRLHEISGRPGDGAQLPDTFTAAHIANRAARMSVIHGHDASSF